jgi:hypothetical protein
MGESLYLADYVFPGFVVDVIASNSDRRIKTLEKFKKFTKGTNKIVLLVDDGLKDILELACDETYTASSMDLLVEKIKKVVS